MRSFGKIHQRIRVGGYLCYNEENYVAVEINVSGDSMDMEFDRPLRILILAAEIVPFAKVGGLADVVGALPKALQDLGHDVRLAMPRYGQVSAEGFQVTTVLDSVTVKMSQYQEQARVMRGSIGNDIPVYMIDAPRYFDRENIYGYTDDGERFILFCRAALETMRLLDWSPDIIHCNDWQTGIVPNWMHTNYREDPFFGEAATVYTIHNLAYQGIFAYRILAVAAGAAAYLLLPPTVDVPPSTPILSPAPHPPPSTTPTPPPLTPHA